jgi:hypothetical protein
LFCARSFIITYSFIGSFIIIASHGQTFASHSGRAGGLPIKLEIMVHGKRQDACFSF